MPSITSSAVEVLATVREQQGVPEHYGVRLYPERSPQGVHVQLEFTEEPADGDEVVESEGTSLYVAEDLAEPLADAVIDAGEAQDGSKALVLRGVQ